MLCISDGRSIANMCMFCVSDSMALTFRGEDGVSAPSPVTLLNTGIAWDTDKTVKFKNPDSESDRI